MLTESLVMELIEAFNALALVHQVIGFLLGVTSCIAFDSAYDMYRDWKYFRTQRDEVAE